MALHVIGAGFGRTGTTSLKAALEQLGFSKCHHMQEVATSRKQVDFWHALAVSRADGSLTAASADWDSIFEGYQASCDWPSCTYWEELHRHFPDAKIILSVRDENRWYDSCAETIHPVSFLVPTWISRLIPPLDRMNKMVIAAVWDGEFDGRFREREHALEVYRAHVAYVKATAPPDQLLVFEAKDGWEPLCRFLEVPVPEGSYPHLNDAATIRRMIVAVKTIGWLCVAGLVLGAASLLL
jgi:hypothetical protein